jgi:hypothetical protein
MSRNKPTILPAALELKTLDLAQEVDDTAALRAVARENTRILQIAAFEEVINDEDSPLVEADRAAVLSLCGMNPTELQIHTQIMEVYDRAKSHFLFDIVEVQVKRFLNADRLKAEAEQPAAEVLINQGGKPDSPLALLPVICPNWTSLPN